MSAAEQIRETVPTDTEIDVEEELEDYDSENVDFSKMIVLDEVDEVSAEPDMIVLDEVGQCSSPEGEEETRPTLGTSSEDEDLLREEALTTLPRKRFKSSYSEPIKSKSKHQDSDCKLLSDLSNLSSDVLDEASKSTAYRHDRKGKHFSSKSTFFLKKQQQHISKSRTTNIVQSKKIVRTTTQLPTTSNQYGRKEKQMGAFVNRQSTAQAVQTRKFMSLKVTVTGNSESDKGSRRKVDIKPVLSTSSTKRNVVDLDDSGCERFQVPVTEQRHLTETISSINIHDLPLSTEVTSGDTEQETRSLPALPLSHELASSYESNNFEKSVEVFLKQARLSQEAKKELDDTDVTSHLQSSKKVENNSVEQQSALSQEGLSSSPEPIKALECLPNTTVSPKFPVKRRIVGEESTENGKKIRKTSDSSMQITNASAENVVDTSLKNTKDIPTGASTSAGTNRPNENQSISHDVSIKEQPHKKDAGDIDEKSLLPVPVSPENFVEKDTSDVGLCKPVDKVPAVTGTSVGTSQVSGECNQPVGTASPANSIQGQSQDGRSLLSASSTNAGKEQIIQTDISVVNVKKNETDVSISTGIDQEYGDYESQLTKTVSHTRSDEEGSNKVMDVRNDGKSLFPTLSINLVEKEILPTAIVGIENIPTSTSTVIQEPSDNENQSTRTVSHSRSINEGQHEKTEVSGNKKLLVEKENTLTDTEKQLIFKRSEVMMELINMESLLQQIESRKLAESDCLLKLERLNMEIRLAEEELAQQRKSINSVRTDISEVHKRVIKGRSECTNLSRKCMLLGTRIKGKEYKVPPEGSDIMNDKLQRVINQTRRVSKQKGSSPESLIEVSTTAGKQFENASVTTDNREDKRNKQTDLIPQECENEKTRGIMLNQQKLGENLDLESRCKETVEKGFKNVPINIVTIKTEKEEEMAETGEIKLSTVIDECEENMKKESSPSNHE